MRKHVFNGIIIAHLGNTDGRQPELENTLPYVQQALKNGWHVCVNVFFRHGRFFLPHAAGQTVVTPAALSKQRMWCRAHDADTADALCNINAHCFFPADNGLTLTSAQFVWTLPPHTLSPRSIAAFPETTDADWLQNYEPAGLCSNEPVRYI